MSDTTKPKNQDTFADARPDVTRGVSGYGVRTSDTTTRGIRIEVQSMFMPERSSAKDSQYLFEYHVRISNVGAETAQLISREWVITNADGEVERVKGPGVVGEQPVLTPGASSSWGRSCGTRTRIRGRAWAARQRRPAPSRVRPRRRRW